jgi:hypothetical protein
MNRNACSILKPIYGVIVIFSNEHTMTDRHTGEHGRQIEKDELDIQACKQFKGSTHFSKIQPSLHVLDTCQT